jgi:hypothetical protein
MPPVQDLRSPDTKDAATRPARDLRAAAGTSSLAGTTAPAERPASPAPADNDTPWASIGLVLAGAAIAAGGAGIATTARRRSRVTV